MGIVKQHGKRIFENRRCGGIAGRRAFTLIELLVVIAIVAVLIALSVPVLAKAKMCVRRARESALAQQVMVAYTAYSVENRDSVLVGHASAAMVNGPMPVHDGAGTRLTGEVAQRYPWRLAPALNYDFRGLQDARAIGEVVAHPEQYTPYGVDYNYVVSLYPSLGLNSAFVGGSDRHSEFDPVFRRAFGRVYIERMDQSKRPSELLVFASARGEAIAGLPALNSSGGFFRLEPPLFAPGQGYRWQDNYVADSASPGLNSGYVSLRFQGKAVAAFLDGHAALRGWTDLQDMRMWSDDATSPGWTLGS